MVTISDYQENDFSGLCELMKHWDKDYSFLENDVKCSILNIMKYTDNKLLVAKREQEIVGYAQIAKCYYLGFDPSMEVVQLLVSENNRSLGIGSLLMNYVEQEAIRENIFVIRLHSQVQRSRAHVFYEKLGYNYYKISKFYEKKLNK